MRERPSQNKTFFEEPDYVLMNIPLYVQIRGWMGKEGRSTFDHVTSLSYIFHLTLTHVVKTVLGHSSQGRPQIE